MLPGSDVWLRAVLRLVKSSASVEVGLTKPDRVMTCQILLRLSRNDKIQLIASSDFCY